MDPSENRIRLFDWRILPLLGVSVLVIWGLVTRLSSSEEFWGAVGAADPVWIGVAALLMGGNLLLASLRLKLVIESMEHSVPFFRSLDAVMSTWPLGLLTPSRASDVLRALVLRDRCPPWEGAGAVVAEKVVDVQSLCLLTLVGGVWTGLHAVTGLALAMLVGLWSVVTVVILGGHYRRLPLGEAKLEKLARLVRVFEAFRSRPWYFLAVSATSMVAWVNAILIATALLTAFGAGVAVSSVAALWPLSIFVGMLPLTMAGMGTRDAAFLSLLALTSPDEVQEAAILAGTVGYALLTAWAPAIPGLPLMIRHMALFRAAKRTDVKDE